jgi:hypothetical protein
MIVFWSIISELAPLNLFCFFLEGHTTSNYLNDRLPETDSCTIKGGAQ